jgi:hypothetical protein
MRRLRSSPIDSRATTAPHLARRRLPVIASRATTVSRRDPRRLPRDDRAAPRSSVINAHATTAS